MEKTQTQSIFQFYKTILLGYIWIPYEFSYLRILDIHRSRRYQEKKRKKFRLQLWQNYFYMKFLIKHTELKEDNISF